MKSDRRKMKSCSVRMDGPKRVFLTAAMAGTLWFAQSGISFGQPTALVGATVHPVSSPSIQEATLVIEGHRIVAVGQDVAIPSGARRIDVSGKVITPGFIHAYSQVGLIEIGRETVDSRVTDNHVSAGLDLIDAVNPASQLIPVTRAGGVTAVVSVPTGGLISGQALALRLSGDTVEEMLIRAPAAIVGHANASARPYGGGSRAGAFGRLKTLLDDAIAYRDRKQDFEARRMYDLSASAADLEALQPLLDRKIPLVLTANRRSDIEASVRFARDYGVRLIIFGGKEAWMAADSLAAARVPVILDPLENRPTYDGLEPRLDNARLLSTAGVPVIFHVMGAYNPRLLRQHAGNAVAHGMAWEDALRAVTIHPAEALDLAADRGTLEAGKVADLVVWSGDPFELSSTAERVFIGGRETSLRSRQTKLMEKYRALLGAGS